MSFPPHLDSRGNSLIALPLNMNIDMAFSIYHAQSMYIYLVIDLFKHTNMFQM